MTNRRTFLTAPLASAAPVRAMKTRRPLRMKLATQHVSDPAYLRTLAALGVTHVCSGLPAPRLAEAWSVDGLSRLKERVESAGVQLAMVPLPMSSSVIEKAEYPGILLGQSPDRDRAADEICQMIRNCARAGIPAVKYNLSILGVVRTSPTRGRGGAVYSAFQYSSARQDTLTAAGRVPADLYWERITWFLDRVVPAANEYRVRLACHPHDPAMPPGRGFRGVETVLGSVDGLKRFVSIRESPYHGLNFCQGTVCEMLENPAVEIFDVIRWFAARKKVFNVHFRNIQGRFLDFRETFPDDGDIFMPRALLAWHESGYDGMIMPDHVPRIEGDASSRQAFAYVFGYIRALMQLIEAGSLRST